MPFSCALSEMSRNLDTEAVVLQGIETKVFQVPCASSPLRPVVMGLKDLTGVSLVWIFCLRPLCKLGMGSGKQWHAVLEKPLLSLSAGSWEQRRLLSCLWE